MSKKSMTQIVAYRKLLGMTQSDMAKVAGLTTGWYNQKETGKKPWNSDEMEKIITEIRKTYPEVNCTIFFEDVVNTMLTKQ